MGKWLEKRPPNWQKIAEFAAVYELKSILKDIPKEFVKTPAKPPEVAAEKAETPAAADDLFSWSNAQTAAEAAPAKAEKSDKSDAPLQGTLF